MMRLQHTPARCRLFVTPEEYARLEEDLPPEITEHLRAEHTNPLPGNQNMALLVGVYVVVEAG